MDEVTTIAVLAITQRDCTPNDALGWDAVHLLRNGSYKITPTARGDIVGKTVCFEIAQEFDHRLVSTREIGAVKRWVLFFPKERACRRAALYCEGLEIPLPIIRRPDGTTMLCVAIPNPRADTPYTVRWSW